MILLHRPFFQMIRQGVSDTGGKAGTEAMHVEACRSSAEWVSNILRIYKATYTMVSTLPEVPEAELTVSNFVAPHPDYCCALCNHSSYNTFG